MSVNFNLVSAELSDEAYTSIIASIKSIETQLSFAVTLPPDEKAGLPGFGVFRMDFTFKTYDYAVNNPEMVPSYLDMVEFAKDANLAKKLKGLIDHLVPLVDKLKDTYGMAGSEAYNSARVFYHHVKNAALANVPGASAIAKELGKHFKKGAYETSSSKEEKPEEPAAAAPAVSEKSGSEEPASTNR